jgi:flagellar hook assembly protein FlgD
VSDGTVTVKVDGAIVTKVSGDSLDALVDGPHTVHVEATDVAGNTGYAEVALTVQAPPVLTVNSVTTPTSTSSQTISGTKSPDAVLTVTAAATATIGTISYPTTTSWSCTISGLAEGTNNITVIATDPGGETTTAAVSITYYVLSISNVTVSTNTINTAASESASLFFTLSGPATATFKIIPEKDGSSGTPIYQATQTCSSSGAYMFTWDGKDNVGNIVSDEAYLYIIEAVAADSEKTVSYNPAAPTATVNISCTQGASYDPYRNKPLEINYTLAQPARAKLAIKNATQLAVPLNNVPYYTGNYRYEWAGRDDQDNLMPYGATASCSATPLGENVIITTGDTPQITSVKADPYEINLSYGEFTRIQYTLSRNATVTLTLTSPLNTVYTLKSEPQTAGAHEVKWPDPATNAGNQFAVSEEGIYTITIQAVTTSGRSYVAIGVLKTQY